MITMRYDKNTTSEILIYSIFLQVKIILTVKTGEIYFIE